jgi:hypothetical protein
MGEITLEGFRNAFKKVYELYKNFITIENILIEEQDNSKLDEIGLIPRDEKVIGCHFSLPNRQVGIYCYKYKNGLEKIFANATNFIDEERTIFEETLSKAGLTDLPLLNPPNLETIEVFLKKYFESEIKIKGYYKELNELENKKRELLGKYL